MSHTDSNFYKPFVFVLGALIIFTVFILFVANAWSPDSPDDPLAIAETKKSIQPVGQSRVDESAKTEESDAAAPDGSGDSAAADAVTETPEAQEVEETTAQAETEESTSQTEEVESTAQVEETEESTETASVEGEPAAETTQVVATTTASAGAAAFASDAVPLKVKAVVATNCAGCHNAGLHGAAKTDDSEAWTALSGKGIDALTASVIDGKGKMPARAESTLSDEEIGQAVQLMVFNATGSGPQAASAAAAATAVATTSDTATEETTTEDASAEVASSEIPAEVMQVVDSTCSACHQAGVGNSPKLGDKDAWGARLAAKGIDGLTASSIAGIGVMPPRGGSSLDDEQMKLAVEYMLSK